MGEAKGKGKGGDIIVRDSEAGSKVGRRLVQRAWGILQRGHGESREKEACGRRCRKKTVGQGGVGPAGKTKGL